MKQKSVFFLSSLIKLFIVYLDKYKEVEKLMALHVL